MKKITGIVLLLFVAFVIVSYFQREVALFSNGQEDKFTELDNTRVSFSIPNITVNKKAKIQFTLQDEKGTALRGLNDTEQGKVHAVIMDDNLTHYEDIHPKFSGKGLFLISHTFKKKGQYSLFLYVQDGQKREMFAQKSIQVGKERKEPLPLQANSMLTTTVDGIQMSVIFNLLEAEKKEGITFRFQGNKEDLYTLSSASGKQPKLMIADETNSIILFAAPEKVKKKNDISFSVTFPKPGLYKIWADFYINGKGYEKEFVVTVTENKKAG
ncbi:hypothetical protein [Bacillus sp. 165]|uniref:hypothetical protein n=1 Tax=Bacillus sp. 165 TaxID=1529117 RepID=UPI001ADAFC61|nr:hypothetical protein [Bacillus sp. 165]MBO9128305.1 hypothetical protein [Bacillus sp. 165]